MQRWIKRICGAFFCLTVAVSASAHVDDPNGLSLQMLGAHQAEGGVEISLILKNQSGGAVTLRNLSAIPGGQKVFVARRQVLFGYETWQTLTFLRVEPGKTILLSPPDYRVLAPKNMQEEFTPHQPVLRADFGPRGVYQVEGFGRP